MTDQEKTDQLARDPEFQPEWVPKPSRVVYNINPKGTPPIVIVLKWRPDPTGLGPAIQEQTVMLHPGEGVDLAYLGLGEKSE